MAKKLLNTIYYLLMIMIISKVSYINSIKLNERYPSTYLLSNGDVFLVTGYGFRLYDSKLQNMKNYYNFPTNQQKITSSNEAELTSISQFSDGIIIALVKNILYVFSSSGNYILQQNLSSFLANGRYFNLIAHKYDSSFYYYIIAYFDNRKISIKYFHFSKENNISLNNPLSSISYSEGIETGKQIQEYGTSCQIMIRNDNELLTCFYEICSPTQLTSTSFIISETEITVVNMDKKFISNNHAYVIKSVTSPDKKLALICYTMGFGGGYCLQYDIITNEFISQEKKYFNYCLGSALGINVYYFKEKNEYMFICYNNIKGFNVVLFNSNFEYNIPNSDTKSEPYYIYGRSCFHVNSFNIVYSLNSNEYIIINDCDICGPLFLTGSANLDELSENNNNYPMDGDKDTFNIETNIIVTNKITSNTDNTAKNDETEELSITIADKLINTNTIEIPNDLNEVTTTSLIKEVISTNSIESSTYKNEDNNENSSLIVTSSSKSKDEIINNLQDIIKDKDPDSLYLIEGNNYSIIIKPINVVVKESSCKIDFTECEKILKKEYPSKKFRIVQINIENPNDRCITDQVEYKIFDELGQEINLSVCKDVQIQIEYNIKDTSSLDIQKISDFKDKGIDILNINDTFFNDICYPYADEETKSDMILSDRVSDIYQNYSLCGDECEYNSFNLDKMTVYCNCKVKQEVNSEITNGNFKTYLKDSFEKSNFGIIRCFNQFFSLKDIVKNSGFWIFVIMIVLHIPLYVLLLVNGMTAIKKFIANEMESKGYNATNNIIFNNSFQSKRKESSKNIKKYKQKKRKSNPPKKENDIQYYSSDDENDNRNKNKIFRMNHFFTKNMELNNDNINNHSEFEGNIGNLRYKSRFYIIKSRKSVENQTLSSKTLLNINNLNNFESSNKIKTKSKFYKNDFPNKPEPTRKFNSSTKNIVIRYSDLLIHPIKKNSDNLIINNINNEDFMTMNTKANSSTKMIYIKEEDENEVINSKKDLKKGKIKFFKNKKKIKMNYMPTRLESNEFLKKTTETKNIQGNKARKKSKFNNKKGKNIETDENITVDNKKLNNEIQDEYPLILINANNTWSYSLKSKYILINYDFEEIIKCEERSFWRIFFIYLIAKENSLNLIFLKLPLELRPLRICLFIFNYACDFSLNALFYLSDNISDKYRYQGHYKILFLLINNITITIASSIATFIIVHVFQSLTHSNSKIEDLFREEEKLLKADKNYKVKDTTKMKIQNEIVKILKCLKIKIIFFLILEFSFLAFFLYYVTIFCQIYQKTQLSWLLDSISTYVISILFTLVLSFICAIFYKIALNNKRRILYRILIFIYNIN